MSIDHRRLRFAARTALPMFLLLPSAAGAATVAVEADAIVVTGTRPASDAISSATRTPTAIVDIPQAISVVDADTIAARGLTSMADLSRLVPGAGAGSGEGNRDQIILRGQSSTADFFVDGIRDDVQYYRGFYNLDRVEVLKGPSALAFGRGGGGGVINRVTKRADQKARTDAAVSGDNWGAASMSVDVDRPLGDGLAVRVNAVADRLNTFRDQSGGHRLAVNPTVGWQADSDTRIDLSYEHDHDRRTVDRGIPSRDGVPLTGARRQFFGDPDANRTQFDADVVDLAVDHRLSSALHWTTRARVGHYDKAYANAMAVTPVSSADTVGIEAYRQSSRRNSRFIQSDLVAAVATGPVAHTLLAGVDHGRESTFADRQQGFFDAAGTIQRWTVPLSSSDGLPTIHFIDSPLRRATAADTVATSTGVYVQDQARFGDHVELVAGLRRDYFQLDYADRLSLTRLSRRDSRWSPRVGLVIRPDTRLSLYASASTSFLPQSGDQFSSLTATTAALAPEKFVNRELGAKWAPHRGVLLTMAVYRLDRTNTRATDPVSGATVLTGAERSTGVEFSAEASRGRWTLTAAGALQRARIVSTTAAAVAGAEVAGVPHATANAWARYAVSPRLALAGGVVHQSSSFASISNAVRVPGWTRVDAAAFIAVSDRVEVQVNLENLFDADYIALTNSDNNLVPGAPRTARATLRLRL